MMTSKMCRLSSTHLLLSSKHKVHVGFSLNSRLVIMIQQHDHRHLQKSLQRRNYHNSCTLLSSDNDNKYKIVTTSNGKEIHEVKKSNQTKFLDIVVMAIKSCVDVAKDPKGSWKMVKEVAHHYWVGSKLLWSEMKMSSQIMSRIVTGHGITRREREQLLRTVQDMFRLIPFSVFVIVPFMELLLPIALKLFPNMLPSTFQDSLAKEENMKKELQMRLAIATFMQETLQEMAKKQTDNVGDKDKAGALEVIEFMERAKLGEPLSNESVIRISQLFKDELTLANITRPQLTSMCRYMGLQPYGADAFLRFQLRTKLRLIKDDDRRILWEGINSLTTEELRYACRDRGMRSVGMTAFAYKRQLQEWLDLSIQKSIPISLLIMSRAFSLSSSAHIPPEDVLKNSISSLDSEVINEVVLAVAKPGEENTIDMKNRKLESLQFQKEMIEDEREENDEAIVATMKDKKKKNEGSSVNSGDKANTISLSSSTISVQKDSKIAQSTATAMSDLPKKEEKKQELSVDEIQAIGDLTRGSSVEREKAQLAILEAGIEAVTDHLDVKVAANDNDNSFPSLQAADEQLNETLTPTGETVQSTTAARKQQEDVSVLRVKSALSSMIDNLKTKIDTTEKALGDRLRLLDIDNDGELSSEELKTAIFKSLKRTLTEEEVEEMVQRLDKDKDGKVSVLELLQYIEARKDKREVEVLEAQVSPTAEENARK